MSTEVRDSPDELRYELLVDGRLAGFAQYRLSEDRITMFHTEVEPEYEGRGLGQELARAALNDVRRRGVGLVPVCPFIAAYVRRHPDDYLGLVVPGMREKVMEGAERTPSFIPSLPGGQLGGAASDFVIVQWSDSGDSEWEWIAPLHVHHADDEAWYVLEGVLRFRIGDEEFEAGPGGAVLAPKGIAHSYGNARRGQIARYLLVMTPKIRALVEALHEPGANDYAAIFRAHDSELLS